MGVRVSPTKTGTSSLWEGGQPFVLKRKKKNAKKQKKKKALW